MINQIKVRNFKCFEEMSVECRALNLFTGLNGVGKSTLIQALLLFCQTYERNQFGQNQPVLLNGCYVSLGKIKDISYWYGKNEDISLFVEEDIRGWECRYSEKAQALLAGNCALRPKEGGLAGNGFEYISAERLGPRRYYDDLRGGALCPFSDWMQGENTRLPAFMLWAIGKHLPTGRYSTI